MSYIPLFKEFKTGNPVIRDNEHIQMYGYQYVFLGSESVWVINHNANTFHFLIEVIINGEVIKLYDLIVVDENTVKIDFGQPMEGIVNFLVLVNEEPIPDEDLITSYQLCQDINELEELVNYAYPSIDTL